MTHTLASEGPWAAYFGLFWLLALAWAGLPTAGQAALVGAGVLASEGELDLVLVIVVGTLGSIVGGIAGYWLGRSGGRALWAAPGPMHHKRLTSLASGERLFARYGAPAVFVVPMWLAGIADMPWRSFLIWNAAAALAWTLAGGLGGYLIGPAVITVLDKAGTVGIVAGAVVVAGVVLYRWLKSRHDPPVSAD